MVDPTMAAAGGAPMPAPPPAGDPAAGMAPAGMPPGDPAAMAGAPPPIPCSSCQTPDQCAAAGQCMLMAAAPKAAQIVNPEICAQVADGIVTKIACDRFKEITGIDVDPTNPADLDAFRSLVAAGAADSEKRAALASSEGSSKLQKYAAAALKSVGVRPPTSEDVDYAIAKSAEQMLVANPGLMEAMVGVAARNELIRQEHAKQGG